MLSLSQSVERERQDSVKMKRPNAKKIRILKTSHACQFFSASFRSLLAFVHSQQRQTSFLLVSPAIRGCTMEYIHFAEERGLVGHRDGSRRERQMVRGRTNEGSRSCQAEAEATPRGGFVFLAFFPSFHSEVGERFNIPDNGYKSTFRPSDRPSNLPYIDPSIRLHSRPLPINPKAHILNRVNRVLTSRPSRASTAPIEPI